MTIFLILAPFGSFALLMLVTSAEISLFAAAAICLAVIGIDVVRGRSIKMLGAGCVVVFTGLGAYVTLIDPNLSSSAVKLAVDVGVLAISLASLIIRKPFVLQYALEEVDAETAKLPGFMKATYIITWAWTGAFVLMIIGNVLHDLRAGLAALVRTCDRLRRPQQCRLFHDMVSPISQGEVWCARRRTPCPAPTEIIFEPKHSSSREQHDEKRIRETGRRLFLHHRVPRDLPHHRQRVAGDGRRDRRRGCASDLLPRQGQRTRLHDLGQPCARDRARQRHVTDPRPSLRAGEARDRTFRDRHHHAQARLDAAL